VAALDHRQHLGSLDGVRGLAILMVLCHHLCPFPGRGPVAMLCSTLWLGVDLFFVLSGFLITGILHDTLGKRDYFRSFYMRRALRLLPAYVAVVAVVLAANAAMGGQLKLWALPYLVYGSNIVRDMGVPTGIVNNLDVSHLWSLAVEEQFYLLWPLAVFLVGTRRRILWLCASGAMFSAALRFAATGHAHLALGTPYFELPMRLDSLLLGGALAILLRNERTAAMLTPARLHAALIAGLLALAMSFAASGHATMFAVPMVRYGYFAAAVSFAALIGLAVTHGSWVARVGCTPLLRLFGRCSYGLYLVHLVARHWYAAVLDGALARCSGVLMRDVTRVSVFFVYLLLCLGLALLSYSTLERYFLSKKRRVGRRAAQAESQHEAAYAH
jgi:peptidoglycan/LPS O-acetylase OafA/YrhL